MIKLNAQIKVVKQCKDYMLQEKQWEVSMVKIGWVVIHYWIVQCMEELQE